MCRILASEDPSHHESHTRSVRLNGQSTSIRLERAFWQILDRIAEDPAQPDGAGAPPPMVTRPPGCR